MGLISDHLKKGVNMKNSSLFVLLILTVMGSSSVWIGPADGAEPVLSEATFYVA